MNCPYCKRYFSKKSDAVKHINRQHGNHLIQDEMNAEQALYFSTHGTLHGKCICGCDTPTEWNYKTGKPYKVSPDPSCRKRLNAKAEENLKTARGINKQTLMGDMEHQRDMQKNRPSAGKYKFHDGGEVEYLSSIEKNWLQFCDIILEFTSNMVQKSPESFPYWDPVANRTRLYDPDFYLPDYNLLVENKDAGNTNPAFIKETKYKVALKDEAMKKQNKYNYIRISGTNYGPFVETLFQIVQEKKAGIKSGKTLSIISESALVEPDDYVQFGHENYENATQAYFCIFEAKNADIILGIGLSDRLGNYWYVSDFTYNTLSVPEVNQPIFDSNIRIYKYLGDMSSMIKVLNFLQMMTENSPTNTAWNILDILLDVGNIYFDNNHGCANNDKRKMQFTYIGTKEQNIESE